MFSNYSIKKILPRLIIVAIAVNLSFYICAFMVDISNILGANLRDFIKDAGGALPTTGGYGNFKGAIGWALGGAFMVLATAGMIILILCNLGTVFLAILLTFAVLAVREVLVTVLIIISPIAFVLYLLPNTEKWFKKWLNEFARMLFVYPAIAFVWGATELVTSIILNSGMDIVKFIMVCLVQVVPVIAILPVMKMGGQALGALQGLARKGLDRTPIKDIGNNLGRAAKSGGLTALSNRMSGRRGIIGSDGKLRKDEDGNILNSSGRIVAKSGSRRNARLTRLQESKPSKLGKMSQPNAFRRATGTSLGFLAGLGDGNLKEQTKAIADTTKANTSASKRTEELKLDLANSAQTLKRALQKQEYELDIKAKPHVMRHAAAMKVGELKAQGGEGGIEKRMADEMMEQAPGNAAVAAHRDAILDKLVKESGALRENKMRLAGGRPISSGVAGGKEVLEAISNGEQLFDGEQPLDVEGNGLHARIAAAKISMAANSASTSEELQSILDTYGEPEFIKHFHSDAQPRIESDLNTMREKLRVMRAQDAQMNVGAGTGGSPPTPPNPA
jgi:phage gp16-like protein